ncbi:hypothetical protein Mal15_69560 [Stieleria maiorica]|uniref:Type II secretion system protein GspC N-terminal domain-containing protein n=1 Tax=Stieleria maiorica TaxID=2795974 RepID=A0A5B9MSA7_9BACT|nr:hypothetical protein [Stieleria maiorica]QEG02835.1 hypothetical protein Mal15_69560 [Stieleria maiorica]
MDVTAQRRLLNTLTAGLVAFAAGGVVWSLGDIGASDPPAVTVLEPPNAALDAQRNRNAELRSAEKPSAGSAVTGDVLSLKLLQPLYDPPKPPPPKPQPKPQPVVVRNPPAPRAPRLDWTLTGTIIDADRSVAILTDASGKTDIRAAGEVVELSPAGVLVRKIDSQKVTLELRGTESTLRLQPTFQPGGGANADRQNRRRNR